jgi:1-acyl-sn-glycerol-3-phosphate acyltransferase
MRVPPAPVRRAITIPALLVFTAIGAAVLTVVVVVTGPVSLLLRGRWRAVRLGCFLLTYLVLEIAALACALAVWVRHLAAPRTDAGSYCDVNFRLIEGFLRRLYAAARRLFGLRVEVAASAQVIRETAPATGRGGLPAPPGPAIVLSRHAGPGDAFLLVYALLAYAGRRPFVVLKDTLAFDPWIDVLLGRVPHRFIRPDGANDGAAQAIADLAAQLSERDALVIFPEGGNFTAGRRRGAIRRLWRRGQRRRARQAARLGHVLPPRPAGARCAMDAAPDADLIVVAHTGLDHLDSAAAVWRGIPLERPLRVTWWRVPAAQVPTGQDARTDWLYDQWAKVDAWIESNSATVIEV